MSSLSTNLNGQTTLDIIAFSLAHKHSASRRRPSAKSADGEPRHRCHIRRPRFLASSTCAARSATGNQPDLFDVARLSARNRRDDE